MRTVVLQMGVSLDGFVAGPGGNHDWGLPGEHPDVAAWKLASLGRVGTHIMGRTTYQEMAGHWPSATDDYAQSMNSIPKVVFSRTLTRADWAGSTALGGGLPLFKDLPAPLPLNLHAATTYPDGTAIHIYRLA